MKKRIYRRSTFSCKNLRWYDVCFDPSGFGFSVVQTGRCHRLAVSIFSHVRFHGLMELVGLLLFRFVLICVCLFLFFVYSLFSFFCLLVFVICCCCCWFFFLFFLFVCCCFLFFVFVCFCCCYCFVVVVVFVCFVFFVCLFVCCCCFFWGGTNGSENSFSKY